MREKQLRLLVIWGKYELSFDPSEPEAYRRVTCRRRKCTSSMEGIFALDTAADQIAELVRDFLKRRVESLVPAQEIEQSLVWSGDIRLGLERFLAILCFPLRVRHRGSRG